MFAVGIVGWFFAGVGIILFMMVALLFAEIWAGCRQTPLQNANFRLPARFAVIVPAHNEAANISNVLLALQSELRPVDRLVVIADNCQDNTYEIARSTGAEVIRRDDQAHRGKGFALDAAVRFLAADPPDVVIVMDADCYASEGSLATMAGWASAYERPVQAQYEMLLPPGDESPAMATAAFSYRVKAMIRPSGLRRLGLPCGLMGTGMAFPWAIISQAHLATSNIVEDLLLTLEVARKGKAPLYCSDAKISSTFPATKDGQKSQRERWETGHVNVICQVLPKTILASLRTGNLQLLALAADMAIPPLALMLLLITCQFSVSLIIGALGGPFVPLLLGFVNALLFFIAIALAWRASFPGKGMSAMLTRVPGYVLGKLSIYLKVALRRRPEWVRTQRE